MTRLQVVARTLSNAPLVAFSVARMVANSPAHFLVQLLRRFPAVRLPEGIAQIMSRFPIAAATWQFLLDHPDEAQAALRNVGPTLWANELRLNLRVPVEKPATSRQVARQSWEGGDVEAARESENRRLIGEAKILDPDLQIELPHNPKTGMGVLHFLTNSLPWTNSGYSLRSQGILQAQISSGINAQAATRLAYPVIIGRPQAGREEMVGDVTYHRLLPTILHGPIDLKLATQARLLADLTRGLQPALVHTTTNFHNALTVDAVARAADLPWVYEMRGEMEKTWVARQPKELQAAAESSERFRLMRARETQMAQRADAVVALSKVQAESLVQRGIDPGKLWVVPNAVDEALLQVPRDPQGAREQLGLPEGFWVGAVSAMVAYEGFGVLLEAIAWCRTQGYEVRGLLVGDGVTRPQLMAQSQALGIDDLVVFPGKVSPQDAPTWYQALDVMVIPRLDTPVTRAVTPIKGLSAMALGIPQVVSALPALQEIAVDDGQGLAVSPEDPVALGKALIDLAQDPEARLQLGTAGRTAARTRTWTAAAQTYDRIYAKVCHGA